MTILDGLRKRYVSFIFSDEGIERNRTSFTTMSTSMPLCYSVSRHEGFHIFVAEPSMDDCDALSCVLTDVRTVDHLFTFWSFDRNVLDLQNKSNAIAINQPYYYAEYAGSGRCILFNGIDQYAIAPYIPLNNRSFTIEVFIFLNLFSSDSIFTILSQCASTSGTNQCLTVAVSSTKLLFSFSDEYHMGTATVVHNRW